MRPGRRATAAGRTSQSPLPATPVAAPAAPKAPARHVTRTSPEPSPWRRLHPRARGPWPGPSVSARGPPRRATPAGLSPPARTRTRYGQRPAGHDRARSVLIWPTWRLGPCLRPRPGAAAGEQAGGEQAKQGHRRRRVHGGDGRAVLARQPPGAGGRPSGAPGTGPRTPPTVTTAPAAATMARATAMSGRPVAGHRDQDQGHDDQCGQGRGRRAMASAGGAERQRAQQPGPAQAGRPPGDGAGAGHAGPTGEPPVGAEGGGVGPGRAGHRPPLV